MKLLEITSVGFDQPEKLLIKFFFALVTGGKMEVQ
jgi:hypothetical protein